MKLKLLFAVLVLTSAGLLHAQVPDSPVLMEPPNLNIVTSSSITLDWSDVSNALCYIVEVNTDPNFTGVVIVFVPCNDNSYYVIPLSTLIPNTTYYWRIKSQNSFGESDWSQAWSFTTAATPQEECTLLIADINDLVIAGIVNYGQGNALNAKIDAALSSLNTGRNTAAINELDAFKNQVTAFINNERLNQTSGQMLLDRANFILFEIGNENSPVLTEEPVREYVLNQNYPNPFNPSTVISYSVPRTSYVQLKIYDITGQEAATLVSEIQNSGRYNVSWDADKFCSGVYVYTLSAGNYFEAKTMILTK